MRLTITSSTLLGFGQSHDSATRFQQSLCNTISWGERSLNCVVRMTHVVRCALTIGTCFAVASLLLRSRSDTYWPEYINDDRRSSIDRSRKPDSVHEQDPCFISNKARPHSGANARADFVEEQCNQLPTDLDIEVACRCDQSTDLHTEGGATSQLIYIRRAVQPSWTCRLTI